MVILYKNRINVQIQQIEREKTIMLHHFFAHMNRMKFINRWGLMRNTTTENDMEHTMQAAMVAHALAVIGNVRYQKSYNQEHIMALALYHDASEVITGDLPTPIKYYNPQIKKEYSKLEELAKDKLLSMLPADVRETYHPLIKPDETTKEWKVVKAADRICAYLKCVEEKKAGNREFDSAAQSVLDSIQALNMPEVRDFMLEFVPGFGMTLDEISE